MKLNDISIGTVLTLGLIGIMLVQFFSLVALAFFSPSTLPALTTLYNSDHYSWLSSYSFVMLLVCSTCSFATSLIIAWDSFRSDNKRSRLRGLLLSIAFSALAVWFTSAIAILLFGGAWHLASVITGAVMAISLIAFMISTMREHYVLYCRNDYIK